MTGEERRIYPRAEVRWPVSAITAEGSLEGETMNLSMMGAFICCSRPLGLNETVALTINIPNSDHSLTVRAQVVWSNVCVSGDGKSPNGMGVRFIWHSPATSVGWEQ
ncbi:MAG: PilZ domain-containing protein [Deltaproteobacteria bacterium]|nr:MAG: PilZ domain-containing protein [Deltaproteobacteria bacterium]